MADTFPTAPASPPVGPPQGFKDLTELTKWLKILLWSQIVFLIVGLWSGWIELQLLADIKNGLDVTDTDLDASDARQGLIAIAQLAIAIGLGIVFLVWIYRACHNARTIATVQMNFTPGWSIGWYFIPIANIYKPYKAMEEIYRVSENPGVNLKEKASIPIVNGWWALWIISAFVSQLAVRKSFNDETIAGIYDGSLWMFASDLIDIPLDFVALVLVGKVFTMQNSRVRGVSPGI